jgi:hypothetical protein
MGTVDHMGRFLDVEISHPGSTSDFLAFATSDLKEMLERPGFLSPGLVMFGDNAYTNSQYMVTPFKGTHNDDGKDAFNFYHSQLRIKVECAFGRLVHRWGLLRRPMHTKIGLRKTGLLVMAMCRLHNFCINDGDCAANPDEVLPITLQEDEAFNATLSGISLEASDNNSHEPTDLLHGGEHFDDVNRNIRRQLQRNNSQVLPQKKLHESVVNQGLRRPTPKNW